MNVHILMQEKFVDSFIEFMNDKYPVNANLFYIFRNNDEKCCCSITAKNVIYTERLIDVVELANIDASSKLYIHGFYMNGIIEFGLHASKKLRAEQIVLIIYGADLYNNRYILKENPIHPGIWIQEYKKRKLIHRASNFMTFAAPDYELIEKWYGGSGRQYDCLYPSNANLELLNRIRNEEYRPGDTVRILLGNSATVTNRHVEAIEWLSKYRNENIQIICPLSYGDMEYGNRVAQLGKSTFGNLFIPITEYMDIDAYTELLNSVDIAIYNNNRQQATANIEILGYLGKKVFVRSDTTTWGHYVTRDNCGFYDTKTISDMTFEDFCDFDDEARDYNYIYFCKIWNEEYLKQIWDDIMQ